MSLRQLGTKLFRPFITVGLKYDDAARKAPLTMGVVTTVVKTSVADLLAQKVVERKQDIDWKRQGLFVGFGFAYLGGFQYYLYNSFFSSICSPITRVVGHLGVAPVKVFIDQCIHHPFCYFPCFYSLKGAVEGRTIEESLSLYSNDLWENCKALWTLWVPLQFINFAFVPRHLRIPFVAGISLAWTIVLSTMRGNAFETEGSPSDAEIADVRPEALLKFAPTTDEEEEASSSNSSSQPSTSGASGSNQQATNDASTHASSQHESSSSHTPPPPSSSSSSHSDQSGKEESRGSSSSEQQPS